VRTTCFRHMRLAASTQSEFRDLVFLMLSEFAYVFWGKVGEIRPQISLTADALRASDCSVCMWRDPAAKAPSDG